MESLVEQIIRIKNKAIDHFEEKQPLLLKLVLKFTANRRYGYQFLDEEKGILEEYTFLYDDRHIKGYEEGINNVSLTVGIKKSLLERKLKEITASEDDYIKHLFSNFLRDLPQYVLYLLRGDMRFGRMNK